MSRLVIAMTLGAPAVAAFATAAACSSFEDGESPADPDASGSGDTTQPPPDGASTGDGAGADGAADAGDAGPFARTVLTTAITEPWYLTLTTNFVVVTSHAGQGGVWRMAKDGNNPQRIGLKKAFGVAVDGNDVWFCNEDVNTEPGLYHTGLISAPTELRASGVCLEIATFGGEVYFTGGSRDVVQRLGDDGGIAFGNVAANPEGIAADDTGLYYAELHGSKITKAPLFNAPAPLVATGPEPRRVALRKNYLFWVEFVSNDVQRVDKDGANKMLLATGPANTRTGGITADNDHVYWVVSKEATNGGGGVYRVPINGGATVTVADKLDLPIDVAVDDAFIYVTVKNENKVLRFSKN